MDCRSEDVKTDKSGCLVPAADARVSGAGFKPVAGALEVVVLGRGSMFASLDSSDRRGGCGTSVNSNDAALGIGQSPPLRGVVSSRCETPVMTDGMILVICSEV